MASPRVRVRVGREEAAVVMWWEWWEGGNGGRDRWRAKEEVWLGARKAVEVAQRRERQERRRRRVVGEEGEPPILLLLALRSPLLLTLACVGEPVPLLFKAAVMLLGVATGLLLIVLVCPMCARRMTTRSMMLLLLRVLAAGSRGGANFFQGTEAIQARARQQADECAPVVGVLGCGVVLVRRDGGLFAVVLPDEAGQRRRIAMSAQFLWKTKPPQSLGNATGCLNWRGRWEACVLWDCVFV